MSSSTFALLSAAVLSFGGVLQTLGAPEDDPAYKLFVLEIQSIQQQAESVLNTTKDTFEKNIKTLNIPEFNKINSTLYQCFEGIKSQYPHADDYCVQSVEADLQQTVYDSESELAACTNLTYSWELMGKLLNESEYALEQLDGTVKLVLESALACVIKYPYSQLLKHKCLLFTKMEYNTQLENAISLVQEAYHRISGGGMLLGTEVTICQGGEQSSIAEKCNAIIDEFKLNCIPSTTEPPTTTSTEPPTTTSTETPTTTSTETPTTTSTEPPTTTSTETPTTTSTEPPTTTSTEPPTTTSTVPQTTTSTEPSTTTSTEPPTTTSTEPPTRTSTEPPTTTSTEPPTTTSTVPPTTTSTEPPTTTSTEPPPTTSTEPPTSTSTKSHTTKSSTAHHKHTTKKHRNTH